MNYQPLKGLNRNRLKGWLSLFFLMLLIPALLLIYQAYGQLKWEAFHHHQVQAKALAVAVNEQLTHLISIEERRPFSDYQFLAVEGNSANRVVQRSPLSAYPVNSRVDGLLGYFQVDEEGRFSTPLLPSHTEGLGYSIQESELKRRQGLHGEIRQILSENRLVVQAPPDLEKANKEVMAREEAKRRQAFESERRTVPESRIASKRSAASAFRDEVPVSKTAQAPIQAQAAFDQLNRAPVAGLKEKRRASKTLGRVEDLQLAYRYKDDGAEVLSLPAPEVKMAKSSKSRAKKGASIAAELAAPSPRRSDIRGDGDGGAEGMPITTFESDIDSLELSLLDSGHFVLFRKVWRDGQRYIQGALIEQKAFIDGVTGKAFRESSLFRMSDLILAYQGDVLSVLSGTGNRDYLSSTRELGGELLYQTPLSAPLSDIQLLFSIRDLPAGPGGRVIYWVAAAFVVILCFGFYLMYRLGARQIALAEQQQDFVSAVSHELKTPLTSIRMYSEMLKEGWATEEKRRGYYEFIHDESERLSRLINNVLQLARMNRNRLQIELKPVVVSKLMEGIGSKLLSQVERAGFQLDLACDDQAMASTVAVDEDGFSQIIINLVDNGLKFSKQGETPVIQIGCRLQQSGEIRFSVRDYGPGVPKDQMKKIFALFYRSESELTRETSGTGIGLALVNQLAVAMKGRVDVINTDPGAEFFITLPVVSDKSIN